MTNEYDESMINKNILVENEKGQVEQYYVERFSSGGKYMYVRFSGPNIGISQGKWMLIPSIHMMEILND